MTVMRLVRGGMLATAAALALVAGSADAAVKAYADIQLSDLKITLGTPGTVNATIGATQSSASANLLGTQSSPNNPDINSLSSGVADTKGDGIGNLTGIPGVNVNYAGTYGNYTATPGRTDFAFGDSYLKVLSITGGVLNQSSAANGNTIAQALLSDAVGTSSGAAALQSTDQFKTNVSTSIAFSFHYDVAFGALVGPYEGDGSSAAAYGDFSIQVVGTGAGGPQSFSFALKDVLNGGDPFLYSEFLAGDSSTFAAAGDATIVIPFTFTSGRLYNLTIGQSSQASVTRVPEPLSVGLFGAGLVAMGALRRRKAS